MVGDAEAQASLLRPTPVDLGAMTNPHRCKLCLSRLGIDGCPRCSKLTPEELQHRRLIVAGADRARRRRGEVTRHPSRAPEETLI